MTAESPPSQTVNVTFSEQQAKAEEEVSTFLKMYCYIQSFAKQRFPFVPLYSCIV